MAAAPGGGAAPGGPRSALEEAGAPPPGAPQAAPPQAPGEPLAAPPLPAPPPPPPAPEQKFLPPPGQAQQQPPPTAAAPAPGLEDFSFLPLVHDIIKCMEKDSQEVHPLLNELRTKFVEMHKVVRSMQGIGLSPEQQQLQLQNLREQVKTKSKLLQKYKSLCMFEIPKE